MSSSTTPPPARTDVHAVPGARHSEERAVRVAGAILAVGAAVGAGGIAVAGFDPDTEAGILTNNLTGAVFQVGLLGLVRVHLQTRATGTTRVSRVLLQVERVLLMLALAWTLCHALLPGQREAGWLAVLDASWPLSMLGMFLIGLTIAVRGRWRGAARWWALVAETWLVLTMPALGVLGTTGGTAVGVAHLLLGYGVLGVLLATRPDLVEDRG
jgi:hypothetical protein